MFIEPRSPTTLKLREERNIWLSRKAHYAPPELRTLSSNMSYKHLAALRPGAPDLWLELFETPRQEEICYDVSSLL